MYIIAIAWLFVTLLMGSAVAISESVVGGVLTFLFYGALPLGIFMYIFGGPHRRLLRERRNHEADTNVNRDSAK
ncbi:hypothetical protein [Derxia gummosa]|uniref:Uncharacterized protein n=1 Tax=Derxia gummosa DSM 723 TaxID=1121388 RepID=A0A8B6XBF9_9BURK|nr:hypothetical protein [Derxia gummosa]